LLYRSFLLFSSVIEATFNVSAILSFCVCYRNNMFELADRLVGIYKTNDATKSVTINPRMFEAATSGIASRPTGSSSNGGALTKGGTAPAVAHMPLSDVTNKAVKA
jgi:hypothetical protein